MSGERFKQFCEFWGVTPRACKPYRARTKDKVESGVKYVKRNALVSHEFDDWPAFERQLSWWMDEIADARIHGTTGASPLARFEREEVQAMTLFQAGRAFGVVLEHERGVNSEVCVSFETNLYNGTRLSSAQPFPKFKEAIDAALKGK